MTPIASPLLRRALVPLWFGIFIAGCNGAGSRPGPAEMTNNSNADTDGTWRRTYECQAMFWQTIAGAQTLRTTLDIAKGADGTRKISMTTHEDDSTVTQLPNGGLGFLAKDTTYEGVLATDYPFSPSWYYADVTNVENPHSKDRVYVENGVDAPAETVKATFVSTSDKSWDCTLKP
jgi:hypothetical protein